MDLEEFSAIFFKIACPFLLVGTPIFLFGLFSAPNPPEQRLDDAWYVFFSIVGGVVMWFSFQFCKNEMGWFGGKK